MIILTNEEFFDATAVNLYNEINEDDTDSIEAIDITLKRWSEILYKEVSKKSMRPIPEDSKLTDFQVKEIKNALCNLGLYYISRGDIKALGSRDENGNPLDAVPSDLIDDLRHAGLVKLSFGRRSLW